MRTLLSKACVKKHLHGFKNGQTYNEWAAYYSLSILSLLKDRMDRFGDRTLPRCTGKRSLIFSYYSGVISTYLSLHRKGVINVNMP